jgi:hypothetical protein
MIIYIWLLNFIRQLGLIFYNCENYFMMVIGDEIISSEQSDVQKNNSFCYTLHDNSE